MSLDGLGEGLRFHRPVLGHPDHIAEPFLGIEVTHGDVSASLRSFLNGDDAIEGEVDHLALLSISISYTYNS